MNNFTLIPSSIQYKAAPANDQSVQFSLEQKQQLLVEYDRSATISLAEVYDRERQRCTIFRPTFKVTYLYANTLTGTTQYTPFRNNLFYVSPDSSVLTNVWMGFPQYYEFDFFRPEITDQHIDYKAKSAYTYNWLYYVSYAFENDPNKRLYTSLNTLGTWVAKDGIPFTINNSQQNGTNIISFQCIAPHGLSVGEFVKLSFSYRNQDIFEVFSLGNDRFDSEPYIFNIQNIGFTGTTFLNNKVGLFKRVINPDNELETTSKYYIRRHKFITNLEDLIINKTGFEKNLFNEEKKLELSSITPDNRSRISRKTSSNAYNISTAIDFDFAVTRDNQKRPISEIFLTLIFRGYSGYFNERSVNTGIKQGWEFNLGPSASTYWDKANTTSNSNLILSSYTKSNYTFNYTPGPKSGDTMDGDFCEWNDYDQLERVISPYFHKIKFNQAVFQTVDATQSTNAPGYYYQPHNSMTLQVFSDYIETGDVGAVENVPFYSYYSSSDRQFRWRDLYTYGFVDNLGRGVDYPYLNSAHYPYTNVVFRLIPEGINYNGNLLGINFPEKPLVDECE